MNGRRALVALRLLSPSLAFVSFTTAGCDADGPGATRASALFVSRRSRALLIDNVVGFSVWRAASHPAAALGLHAATLWLWHVPANVRRRPSA